MTPRQLVSLAVLCGTIVLSGWGFAKLGVFGSSGVESSAIGERRATPDETPVSADAGAAVDAPSASSMGSIAAAATSPLDLPEPAVAPAATAAAATSPLDLPEPAIASAALSEAATADPDPPETGSILAGFSAADAPVPVPVIQSARVIDFIVVAGTEWRRDLAFADAGRGK